MRLISVGVLLAVLSMCFAQEKLWRGGVITWREVSSEDPTRFTVEVSATIAYACTSCTNHRELILEVFNADVNTLELDSVAIQSFSIEDAEIKDGAVGFLDRAIPEARKHSLHLITRRIHLLKPGDGSVAAFGVRLSHCCRTNTLYMNAEVPNKTAYLFAKFRLKDNDLLGRSDLFWMPALTFWGNDTQTQRFGGFRSGTSSVEDTFSSREIVEAMAEAHLEFDLLLTLKPSFSISSGEVSLTWRASKRGQRSTDIVAMPVSETRPYHYTLVRRVGGELDSITSLDFTLAVTGSCGACNPPPLCSNPYTTMTITAPMSSDLPAAFVFNDNTLPSPVTNDEHVIGFFGITPNGETPGSVFISSVGGANDCSPADVLDFENCGDPAQTTTERFADITFTFEGPTGAVVTYEPRTQALENVGWLFALDKAANEEGDQQYCAVELIVQCNPDLIPEPRKVNGNCTSRVATECVADVGIELRNNEVNDMVLTLTGQREHSGATVSGGGGVGSLLGLPREVVEWRVEDAVNGCYKTGSMDLQRYSPDNVTRLAQDPPVAIAPTCFGTGEISTRTVIGNGWVSATVVLKSGGVVIDTAATSPTSVLTTSHTGLELGDYHVVIELEAPDGSVHHVVYEHVELPVTTRMSVRSRPRRHGLTSDRCPGDVSGDFRYDVAGGVGPYAAELRALGGPVLATATVQQAERQPQREAMAFTFPSASFDVFVNVTDSFGCTITTLNDTVAYEEAPEFTVPDVLVVQAPSCKGQHDAVVNFNVSGFAYHGVITEWYEPCVEGRNCKRCTPVPMADTGVVDSTCNGPQKYNTPVVRSGCSGRRDLSAGRYRVVFKTDHHANCYASPPAIEVLVPAGDDVGVQFCHPVVHGQPTCIPVQSGMEEPMLNPVPMDDR